MKAMNRDWRKLNNEELSDIKSALNYIRVIKIRIISRTGHVGTAGEWRNAYRNLMGTTERKRSEEWEVRLHGRRRRKREDNIKAVIF